jgi:hypothetical protein
MRYLYIGPHVLSVDQGSATMVGRDSITLADTLDAEVIVSGVSPDGVGIVRTNLGTVAELLATAKAKQAQEFT